MTQDATELLKRALALSEDERAELASFLLESLDGPPEEPEAVEAAWNEEIARRIDPAVIQASTPSPNSPIMASSVKRNGQSMRPTSMPVTSSPS